MIIVGALLVTFDVVIRAVAGKSMKGADELSGYLFGVGVAWSLASNLLSRSNVRVDFAYAMLPKPLQAVLDVLGLLLFGSFFTLVAYHAYILTEGSYGSLDGSGWSQAVSPMKTPLAIPQTFWLVGLCLFVVTFVAVTVQALAALARRDLEAVNRICGARTIEEEVAESVGFAEHELTEERHMAEQERLAQAHRKG